MLFCFSRSPSFPLIQDTVLKGKLSVPELRVTRLMNRSISCTMKNPKGELFSYPPNSQVSAALDKSAYRSQIWSQIPFLVSTLICGINRVAPPSHCFVSNVFHSRVKWWSLCFCHISEPLDFTLLTFTPNNAGVETHTAINTKSTMNAAFKALCFVLFCFTPL